jgi:hypothetical protein
MKFKLKPQLKKETMIHHHPQALNHQTLNNLKIKVKFIVTIKFMVMIKGENKVGKLKKDAPQLDDDNERIQPQSQVPHPRVHQSVQQDHPVDNILGSIQKEVTTRSHLATFCGHYSFVSSLEPLKVDKTLDDLDWVIAMQELNNFTRNEVWELVERPKQNVIGANWVFETNKMNMMLSQETRQG